MTTVPRYRLSTEPRFRTLIAQLAAQLQRQGHTTLPLRLAHDAQRYAVPLDPEYFTFEDRRGLSIIPCRVCDLPRDRRFALFVTCADGVTRGPIGSSCLFVHVLGDVQGQELARRLEEIARDALHREDHERRLVQAGSRELYLQALGLAWTRRAEPLARTGLSAQQRAELAAWNRAEPAALPRKLYLALLAAAARAEGPGAQADDQSMDFL